VDPNGSLFSADLRSTRDSYRGLGEDFQSPRESTSPSFDFGDSISRAAESYTTESHVPVDADSVDISGDRRLVIAFDFGTTFTGE
jgi:hypothetical protein